MIIQAIRRYSTENGTELSAEIAFESLPGYRDRVWFRIGPGLSMTERPGDALLAAFFIPAMALGEDLRIEAPVSRELIDSIVRGIQPVLLRWFRDYRAPVIESAGLLDPPVQPGLGVATSFSGGLDSWHTFLRNEDEITHFVHFLGFDRLLSNTYREYFRNLRSLVETEARKRGKTALIIESNLTEAASRNVIMVRSRRGLRVDPTFQTSAYFTSQLVSVAHLFTPDIGKLYIASSYPYEYLYRTASNPLTDPRWSTTGLKIAHDGAATDRTGKVEYLARTEPEALRDLRVCHALGSTGENCNVCEKCLRTRVSLHLAGVLGRYPNFRSPLDLDELQSLYLKPAPWLEIMWRHLLENARTRGEDELVRAIEDVLGRSRLFRNSMAQWKTLLKSGRSASGRKRFRRKIRGWREEFLRAI